MISKIEEDKKKPSNCSADVKVRIYDTEALINDLLEELNKYPETMAKLFPLRVNKFSDRNLSRFWGHNIGYINRLKWRIINDKTPNYEFRTNRLLELENRSVEKLSVRALGVIKIVKKYKIMGLTTLEFIEKVKKEIGRVSGDVEVSLRELSQLFGKDKGFISSVLNSLNDTHNNHYKSDYKFSKEILDDLKENIKVEKYSLGNCLKLIEEFEKLNPNIPYYSHQQYTVSNVNIFKTICPEVAYWHGFLWADGHVSLRENFEIRFSQAAKDKRYVELFADFIGFDRSRVTTRFIFQKTEDGEIKKYKQAVVQFVSKIMNKRLQELGFSSAKVGRKEVPEFIKEAIDMAKKNASDNIFHWSETYNGKIAHAWLIGFYDGDGTYRGGYSARIYAASDNMLFEIKDLFGIPNVVREEIKPGEENKVFGRPFLSLGYYSLNIGSVVFKRALVSYPHSMKRKRP